MSPASTSLPPPFPSHPDAVIKNRWLGFLIWQSIAAFLLSFPLLHYHHRHLSLAVSFLSFLATHLALLLLSLSLFLLLSAAADRRPRRRWAAAAAFLPTCAAAGFLSVSAACAGAAEVADWRRLLGLGFRGLVFGLVFGVHYLYRKRWVLKFPIVQRPLFYSFKMGLSSSARRALKVSIQAFFSSWVLMLFLPEQFRNKGSIGSQIMSQIRTFTGTFVVSFCWEISHHLLQVVHTRRCIFAPPQGSAAAETNPSEIILEALEQSVPKSLIQYLAYLDLCMVSESNAEPWRRAAFFEESGETYRRIVNVCLRPLEQFTSKVAEALEGFPSDKVDFLSQQLNPSMDINVHSGLYEAFNDFQICAWCSRTLAALTARSRQEDRYGVAQITGCNKAAVSALLSALLAVEACVGKKTNPQPAHLLGSASIKWANFNTGRKDNVTAIASKKRGDLHSKAYEMADVLRTSVYQIVSTFLADMQANAKASSLEKNWISEGKPSFGSHAVLVQKLSLFLEYHAV